MSAWGNKDDVASPGTVTVSGTTVTGTNTFFANNFTVGQVITVTSGGSGVIQAITNATSLTITSATEMTDVAVANTYSVSEKPKAVIEGDATILGVDVFGVDTTEAGVATANVAHAGWVYKGDKYTDSNSNVRQKTEVLVAMSTITGDADDDADFPDS